MIYCPAFNLKHLQKANYWIMDAITFKWKDQLRFAKEIANGILWSHDDREIIHGDL